jgi:hypothetical protein
MDTITRQQADGVQVQRSKGLGLIQHAGENHQACAQQGHDGAIDSFGHDHEVSQNKHRQRNDDRTQIQNDLGCRVWLHAHERS